jgi:hypothetical protein
VDLVLDEEVDQRHQGSKESGGQVLAQSYGRRIRRTQRNAARGPRQSRDNVGNHKNVVPVMIIGRCDIRPPPACQGSEDAHERNHAREFRARLPGQKIPQSNQRESRARRDGDKDHEE